MSVSLPGVDSVSFVVAGPPVPRHITISRHGGGIVLASKSEKYQRRIGRAAHAAFMGRRRVRGACGVHLLLVYARRKSDPVTGRLWHTTTPDADKVVRNVLDGLQRNALGRRVRVAKPKRKSDPDRRVGVIVDDCLVVRGSWEARRTEGDEEPHTRITITEMR